ncbi:MAG: hypothetical protein M1827_000471 [Pycnora praestabilis]|nr:MAG: hypothetical protein M1827_000471 [Pycnora praestabilis]
MSPQRSFQDGFYGLGAGMQSRSERPESATKSFFSRGGKMFKKHNNKFSLSSTSLLSSDSNGEPDNQGNIWEGIQDPGQVQGYRRYQDSLTGRKRNISEPYNFQHMTHAHARQFSDVHWASRNELVSEYSAIRAAQAPRRELQGIKADDLLFKNFSSEALSSSVSMVDGVVPTTPPPVHPLRSHDHLRKASPSPVSSYRSLRQARSVDNFSQPSPTRSTKSLRFPRTPRSPVTPPPRTSSKAALTKVYERGPCLLDSPTKPSFHQPPTHNGFRTPEQHYNALMLSPLSAISHSIDYMGTDSNIPHALTTPTDEAWPLKPSGFVATPGELACVPEENDHYFAKRPSKSSLRASIVEPSPPPEASSDSINNAMFNRPPSQSLLRSFADRQKERERPESQLSDTLGDPFTIVPSRHLQTSSMRTSMFFSKVVERCWEDDIDYCYDHEAEANCDFDWDCISEDDVKSIPVVKSRDSLRETFFNDKSERTSRVNLMDNVEGLPTLETFVEALRAPSMLPCHLDIPDLEHQTNANDSPKETEVVTPSLTSQSPNRAQLHLPSSGPPEFKEPEAFTHNRASVLIPAEYETTILDESLYNTLLISDSPKPLGPHSHYALYSVNSLEALEESGTDSLRSSRSPLSKCNSQESIINSSFATSSHRRHCSSQSGGSLPELVHSRSNREEFDAVAEQLNEHIAALSNTTDTDGVDGARRSISPVHRRHRSLAKNVAYQSILKREAASKESVERRKASSPPANTVVRQQRQRSRTISDAAARLVNNSTANVAVASTPSPTKRSPTYTLFPAASIR